MDKITRNINKKKFILKKNNIKEDKIITALEKKLKINKTSGKCLPKSFLSDGLDYLLDVCNIQKNKTYVGSNGQSMLQLKQCTNDDKHIDMSLNFVIHKKKKEKLPNCEKSVEIFIDSKIDKNMKNNLNNCNESKFCFYKNCDSDNKVHNININYNQYHCSKNSMNKKKKKHIKNDAIIQNNSLFKEEKISKLVFENKNKETDDAAFIKKYKVNFDFLQENSSNLYFENDFKNEEVLWEDIYGRKINKDGIIAPENKQKYVNSALKLNNIKSNIEKNKKLLFLKRQINGLLNRLTESNMHVILSELDKLYMLNSRNDMNDMLSKVILECIVTPVLTPERMIIEYAMCITILHANIGTEVGAYFIMIFITKLNEMIEQLQCVQNKKLDNLCLMISHLYNFKVFGSQLIYQILNKLTQKFTEKELELILLFLKTTGFKLRKEDPITLKNLIFNLQQKAATMKTSNSRIQFLLEMLLAIKNNDTKKFSQYNQSYIEHLKKKFKTLITKGKTVTKLNLSFKDLVNVDKKGKWWIIGSACSNKIKPNNKFLKSADNKSIYTKKILNLAESQRMNTDIRKNIFCILMTAEDYLDAFEKLHHLGLKDNQEREIINVILNCLLQEQTYNPYYSVLIQKFCEHDRKYQLIIQFLLWDKLKILNNYNDKQVQSIAKLMSHLFLQKALSLSILKVIQLGELNTITMKLFRKIILDILVYENTEVSLCVFERIAFSTKLHQFREGLRLFINYFLLKNIKKEKIPEKQFQLLENRIEFVDKILTNSVSKISF